MFLRCLPALPIALCLLTAAAHADAGGDGYQGWQFDWDNDMFARTDRWFTNALRLSASYCNPDASAAPVSKAAIQLGRHLLGADVDPPAEDEAAHCVSYTLGQLMYTPARIQIAEPQLHDRPWAGALYAGVTVQGYKGRWYQASDLKLGVTGPPSQADRVQRGWHRLIDADYPAGWEHQLKTKPFAQIGHQRLYRCADSQEGDHFGFHLGGAATLGTHRSYASLLGGVVIGRLKGANPVFSIGNDGDLVIHDFGHKESVRKPLLFANFSLTGVARNRFITGDAAAGRSRVQLVRSIRAVQLGVSLPLPDPHWRLLYVHTLRSAEFKSRWVDRQNGTQRWGTISLNYDVRP